MMQSTQDLEEDAQLLWLEKVSMAETTTLVVLVGIAVPLKHLGGWPVGSQVMGPLVIVKPL